MVKSKYIDNFKALGKRSLKKILGVHATFEDIDGDPVYKAFTPQTWAIAKDNGWARVEIDIKPPVEARKIESTPKIELKKASQKPK